MQNVGCKLSCQLGKFSESKAFQDPIGTFRLDHEEHFLCQHRTMYVSSCFFVRKPDSLSNSVVTHTANRHSKALILQMDDYSSVSYAIRARCELTDSTF